MAASNTRPVLIAGGGIGGLAAALGLAQKGIPSILLEKAAALGEIGAGIQLGPNAFHAFDAAHPTLPISLAEAPAQVAAADAMGLSRMLGSHSGDHATHRKRQHDHRHPLLHRAHSPSLLHALHLRVDRSTAAAAILCTTRTTPKAMKQT